MHTEKPQSGAGRASRDSELAGTREPPVPCARSLAELIRMQARSRGERPAFITPTEILSYAALDAQSNRVAQALAAEGVKAGDTVACLTKHTASCIALLLAASKLGAVAASMNWRLAARELEYLMGVTQPRVLLSDDFLAPLLREMTMPSVRRHLTTERSADSASFETWAAGFAPTDPGGDPGSGTSAVRLFSSGTTGLPKTIDLSHGAILAHCHGWTQVFDYSGETTRLLNVLPTFHVSGLVFTLWMLSLGAVTVCYPQFSPAEFLAAIARHRITDSFVVPTMLRALADAPELRATDLSSLKTIGYGGSPIDEALLKRCLREFPCRFAQIYGMTECSGAITALLPADHDALGRPELLRSAGRPAPHIDLRVVGPKTGHTCSDGEMGEVWVRSAQNMTEYVADREATAAAFPLGRDATGGWLRTGDVGYLREGYLYIRDRLKDMIISGGENVYAAEVEVVLADHSGIAEVAVVGVPDAHWGEVVKAWVVRRADSAVTEDELIAVARSRLAHYKCPKLVAFIESLPRNASGKVLKRVLREREASGR